MNINVNVTSPQSIKDLNLGGISVEQARQLINELRNELTETVTNLLSPENIFDTSAVCFDVEPGKTYCINLPFERCMGILGATVDDEYEQINCYAVSGGTKFTYPDGYNRVIILFNPTEETSRLMLVEGEAVPDKYSPYGTATSVKAELLQPVYAAIDFLVPERTALDTSDSYYLKAGKIYTVALTAPDTSFYLPQSSAAGDQILVLASVQSGGEIVFWGTNHFFNSEVPSIGAGKYSFIFEYDGANWYAGAIEKGEVSE